MAAGGQTKKLAKQHSDEIRIAFRAGVLPFSKKFKRWLREITETEYGTVIEWLREDFFRPTLDHYYQIQTAQEVFLSSIPLPTKRGQKSSREVARKKLKLLDWLIEAVKPNKQPKTFSHEYKTDLLNTVKARSLMLMPGEGVIRKRNPDGTFTETKISGGGTKSERPIRRQLKTTPTQFCNEPRDEPLTPSSQEKQQRRRKRR